LKNLDSTASEAGSGRAGQRFSDIAHRSSVDYALRTVQQGLVHFSALADAKANILITVSALVFSIGLTQMGNSEFRPALLVLLGGSALALVLAVLCARPGRYRPMGDGKHNLLFFLHFAELPLDRYLDAMDGLLSDPAALTAAIVRDIHDQGVAVARTKYRFLRWSYHTLIASIVACAALVVVELVR
jgi:Pycsar effector protein